MRHYAPRGLLIALSAFIAVTAIAGALFVVPTLPLEWLDGSVLDDYTIPALALGFVGGLAIVTVIALIVRPDVASALAVMTGVAMVSFEIVEISVVGLRLVEHGLEEPVAWLQVVDIVLGVLTALGGLGLWLATADDRERLARTSTAASGVH